MVTLLIIAANVYVFYRINKGKDNVYDLGASYASVFEYKQYQKIITSGFTQAQVMHLVLNMYSLYYIGRYVENIYGSILFPILYFVILIVGQTASLMSKHNKGDDNTVSIGASGAICGLLGIYCARMYLFTGISGILSLLPSFLPMIIMSFMPGVDKSGHLYGFLTGAIIGLLFH